MIIIKVKMNVNLVGELKSTREMVVLLQEEEGNRQLPIVIGMQEAIAIAMGLEKKSLPRPMTHELLNSAIVSLGAELSYVCITDLREGTYYAYLALETSKGEIKIDSRPSDAIALALHAGKNIYCNENILEIASVENEGFEGSDPLH